MKILITGGQGYLGGRLCEFLLNADATYDVFCGGRNTPEKQISRVKYVVTDWSSQESLNQCCRGMDVIVHLAGMNATDCSKNAVDALNVNGRNTAMLLEAALKASVKRFIYISTAHVYGSPLTGQISEETLPYPVNFYATSHKAAEDLVLAYYRTKKLDGVVLRLSNAYGRPVSSEVRCWDLLFNDICRQAILEKCITLHSSGLQRRDFIPIIDVCRAIEHIASCVLDSFSNPIFNLGGNWAPTIFEAASLLAERVEVNLGYRPLLKRLLPIEDEVSQFLSYDISRLSTTDFRLSADKISELDGLILFCRDAFGERYE